MLLSLFCSVCLTLLPVDPLSPHASLVWENTTADAAGAADTVSLPFAFRCKNKGQRSVTVKHVSTSCGCTKASIDRAVIEAGQTATLSGEIELGSHGGQFVKTIVVETDDDEIPKRELKLHVSVPPALVCDPAGSVFYQGDSAGKVKAVQIYVPIESGAVVQGAEPPPGVHVVVVPDGERHHYTMTVAVDDLSKAGPQVIFIDAYFPKSGNSKKFEYFLAVCPSPSTRAPAANAPAPSAATATTQPSNP